MTDRDGGIIKGNYLYPSQLLSAGKGGHLLNTQSITIGLGMLFECKDGVYRDVSVFVQKAITPIIYNCLLLCLDYSNF